MFYTQQQQARLSRDRPPDLVSDRQAAAPLPRLLGDKHPQVVSQPALVRLREHLVGGHVTVEVGRPVGREGGREEPPATPAFEPTKQHDRAPLAVLSYREWLPV